MRTMVVAGQERALKVDPQDRRVLPRLGRRDLNLGRQNVGGRGDQRKQLASNPVPAMESPRCSDGVAVLAVRGASTTVVVDVDQPWGQNPPPAVQEIGVVASEGTPLSARPRGQDAAVFERDECVGAVETWADQSD